jgi:hypothetical protein
VSSDSGLLQGGGRLLLQKGASGPGTTVCSNRLLLGFLGVLYEGVEFGFEGGGVGGDIAWFSTHAGVGFENLAASASGRRLVAAAWCCPAAAVRRCPAAVRQRLSGGGGCPAATAIRGSDCCPGRRLLSERRPGGSCCCPGRRPECCCPAHREAAAWGQRLLSGVAAAV